MAAVKRAAMNDDELCACLRVWHEPLRLLGPLCEPADSKIIRIHYESQYDDQQPRLTRQCIEGLALLTLLARVDSRIWHRVLHEIWSRDAGCDWLNDKRTTRALVDEPYQVGLAWRVQDRDKLRLLDTYAAMHHESSAEFVKAIQVIKTIGGDLQDDMRALLRVPVSLMFDFPRITSLDLKAVLLTIQQITTLHHQADNQCDPRLEIVEIRNLTTVEASLESDGLEILLSLADAGIRIDSLPTLAPDCADPLNTGIFTRALKVFLPSAADEAATGVKHVSVSDVTLSRVLAAVLSALQNSASVRALTLRMHVQTDETDHAGLVTQREIWRTIAKSLFGCLARHRLQTLTMELDYFYDEDLETVEEALAEDEATAAVTADSDQDVVHPPVYPEITITSMSDVSSENVALLLKLIGQGTRKLTVRSCEEYAEMDHWTRFVQSACPQLEELAFNHVEFDSLQPFVDCAARGSSRLRRLSLQHVNNLSYDHIRNFFHALRDPEHPLGVHLHELELGFNVVDIDLLEISGPAKAMLDTNRTLRKISIGFKLMRTLQALRPPLEKAFARHLAQKISIPLGTLDVRCKLALLSVVYGKNACAPANIDSIVVATIFEFAAPTMTRQFRVVFP